MMRSALFLPMPEMEQMVLRSPVTTARRSSLTGRPERAATASLGPTPLMVMR